MKWFFVGLFVANLALFGWSWQVAGQHSEADATAIATTATMGPPLTLLRELDAPLQTRRAEVAAPTPSPVEEPVVAAPLQEEVAVLSEPAAQVKPAMSCLRLGAIESQAAAARTARSLEQGGATVLREGEEAGETKRYWVMLSPATTAAAAAPALQRLQRAGIKDFYLIRSGENANAISLGVYSAKDSAQRRLQQIRAVKLAPRVEEITLPAKRWWIEFKWPDDGDKAAWRALLPNDLRNVPSQACR